jgi:hypothetical protein
VQVFVFSYCLCVSLPGPGGWLPSMVMTVSSGGPLAVSMVTGVTSNTSLTREEETENHGNPVHHDNPDHHAATG